MENKKKTIILSVIAIATFAMLIIGATYAYFTAQGGDATSTNLNVTTYTTDVFTFTTGDDINLAITQSDFVSGKGNAVGTTFAKASLTANNKTNTATEHYYVYLNIEDNTFTYSIDESTPELILIVTDNNGNEVTDISGLTHTSVTDAKGAKISGYDITTKSGLITLFNNREITTTSSKEEKWNITITFVNYDANQNSNAGKSMSAKVMIQKEEIIQTAINKVCENNQKLSECIITTNTIDDTLYHHDSTLENGAGDNSYRYAGASESVNNFVCFGSNDSTCSTDNLYRIIGVFGDKVKLIKSDYATSSLLGTDGDYYGTGTPKTSYYKGNLTTLSNYSWNIFGNSNTWSESSLNKINLNTNFINNIGIEWAQKIATTTWKVGGNTYSNIYSKTPSVAYQNEIVNPDPTYTTDGAKEYTAQIGLMYVSDYGFAASPSYWTYPTFNGDYNDGSSDYRAAITSNWMHMGYNEWTISRNASNLNEAFGVDYTGIVYDGNASSPNGARPSFNLLPSITYKSGSGTQSDPIVIN